MGMKSLESISIWFGYSLWIYECLGLYILKEQCNWWNKGSSSSVWKALNVLRWHCDLNESCSTSELLGVTHHAGCRLGGCKRCRLQTQDLFALWTPPSSSPQAVPQYIGSPAPPTLDCLQACLSLLATHSADIQYKQLSSFIMLRACSPVPSPTVCACSTGSLAFLTPPTLLGVQLGHPIPFSLYYMDLRS